MAASQTESESPLQRERDHGEPAKAPGAEEAPAAHHQSADTQPIPESPPEPGEPALCAPHLPPGAEDAPRGEPANPHPPPGPEPRGTEPRGTEPRGAGEKPPAAAHLPPSEGAGAEEPSSPPEEEEEEEFELIWSETEEEQMMKKSHREPKTEPEVLDEPPKESTPGVSEPSSRTAPISDPDEDEDHMEVEPVNDSKADGQQEEQGVPPQKGEEDPEGHVDPTASLEDEDRTVEEGPGEVKGVGPGRPRKHSLLCHDCGKTFTHREAYELHRHFHIHQEEQASLTCKECGLSFQHRSALIKHRSQHKQNGLQEAMPPSRRSYNKELREERSLECDYCRQRFGSLIRYKLHACQVTLEKPYRCPLCRREFHYRVSINAHMQSHSLDSPYRCLECNKGFQCAVTLHIHQRSHAALKPYECPDCGMVFRHRSLMDDHRRKHTVERPHQCEICGKSFKYSSLLQQHQYLHTGNKPYRCAQCGKRFAFVQNMRAHCRLHKKVKRSASLGEFNKTNKLPNGTHVQKTGKENVNLAVPFQRNCPLCPLLFYSPADLRAHMLIHEAEYEQQSNGNKSYRDNPVYTCSKCPLQFVDVASLQSHNLTHQIMDTGLQKDAPGTAGLHGVDEPAGEAEWGDQEDKKLLRCKDCGKSFRYRSVLELHMRVHNRGYQCHICKKSFRFSSYLQQHLIIHSGKKPFKCPDCGKDFAFLQNMKTHQRLHQQKPYRCTQCRKGYSDESQLQRHLLCHSGDKPYKCNLCNKSFGLAYLLRDHLNTHTGERPHRCQECHKSFPWLSSLLVHQKIHTRKRQAMNQSLYGGSQRGRATGLGRGRKTWSRTEENVEGSMQLQQATFPEQSVHGTLPNIINPESQVFEPNVPVPGQQTWQIQMQHQQPNTWLQESPANHLNQQQQPGTQLKNILPKPEALPKSADSSSQETSESGNRVSPSGSPSKDKKTEGTSVISAPKSPSGADGTSQKLKTPFSSNQLNLQGSKWPPESELPIGPPARDLKMFAVKQAVGQQVELDKHQFLSEERPPQPPPWPDRDVEAEGVVLKPKSAVPSLDVSKMQNLSDTSGSEAGMQPMPLQIPQQHPPLQLVLQPQLLPEQVPQMKALQLLQQQQQFHPGGAGQLGSVNVQFGASPFGHGGGGAVFGFQAAQVVPQSLLNGAGQQGSQQQTPLISGSPILLNQTPPFISSSLPLAPPLTLPAPHPLHSLAGALTGPAPQSVFFTPRGLMNERAVLPQGLTPPHVAQRFCCVVCGCTLPGELELQMHYMQHAQGEG